MREQKIEQQLVKAVKKMGGMCPKFISPGFDGMPDRLVLLPNGKAGFVEVKCLGEKLRAIQVRRAEQLQSLGQKAFVLDCVEQITKILEEIKNG
ncbi:hypothetical protein AGMMS49975_09640 [Clostridia bacterium]|nr:hypothetical protein AGMMS49975_09640 [Clostridia bacterium]